MARNTQKTKVAAKQAAPTTPSTSAPQALLDAVTAYCAIDENASAFINAILTPLAKKHGKTVPADMRVALEFAIINGMTNSDVLSALTVYVVRNQLPQHQGIIQNSPPIGSVPPRGQVAKLNPVLTINLTPAQQAGLPAAKAIAASTSPHAPTKRAGPKPNYWIKAVTSFDPNTPNGYGLKGKFVSVDELKNKDRLVTGTPLVIQITAKNKDRHVRLAWFNPSKKNKKVVHGGTTLVFDNVELDSEYTSYDKLFAALKLRGIHPTP